jgi:hypothetical protein
MKVFLLLLAPLLTLCNCGGIPCVDKPALECQKVPTR